MTEFLIVIDPQIDHEQISKYTENAHRYFGKFDLCLNTFSYFRDHIALLWFTENKTPDTIIEDHEPQSLLGYVGAWFFREERNDRHKNLSRLYKKLHENTYQTLLDIEGAYNFIFYDGVRRTLKIITDRIGVTPIYARHAGTTIFLSSSCLLLASIRETEPDPVGLKEFLLANKFFGNTTLFKDIRKLDAASIFEYSQTGNTQTSYWSFIQKTEHENIPILEKVEMMTAELKKIMTAIGTLFESPFTDITGGWDSRTLLLTMPECIPHFYTTTSGEKDDPDVIIAKEVAQKLHLTHYYNPSFLSSEGFSSEKYTKYLKKSLFLTDAGMSAPLYVNVYANHLANLRRGADISLNGSGGELCRPSWWSAAQFIHSDFKQGKFCFPGLTSYYSRRELARRAIHQSSDVSIFTPKFDTDIVGHLVSLFDETNASVKALSNIEQIANIYVVHRMGNWLAGYSKATSRILPCLSPLLMSKPLAIASRLNLKEKSFSKFLRKLHHSANPELSKIGTTHGYPAEPLSWSNCQAFLPAIHQTITTIIEKIARKAGWKTTVRKNRQYMKNLSEIRKVLTLQPEHMKLSEIFDKTRLADFLKKAHHEDFSYVEFYNNIYTVEAVLSLVA